ncbi:MULTISPECIES: hypothetical protein [Pseudonocardia]|uniref:hypothetical protein n=1 Tax=Pseudonocardia TaxID=1847 RepID=UPI000F766392|nr:MULTISPECIES: hypothetical protein [Pseudonocardia]
MNPPNRRTTRIGLAAGLWVAAAAGALLLGLTAVGAIGSGLAGGRSVQPLAAEEVRAELDRHGGPATGPAPGTTPGTGSAPGPAPEPVGVVPAGAAGTILVRCEGGTPYVVSVNPAQGFERDDDDLSPDQVEFDGDDVDVRVTLSCADGTPAGRVETIPDD